MKPMGEEKYTEEEFNRALETQRLTIRLDDIDRAVKDLAEAVRDHRKDEEYSQEQILAKVAEGATDRRRCEEKLRSEINSNHELYHGTFVKKADLRLYALLIIAAVTMTTGFITWLGMQNANTAQNTSTDKALQQIERLITESAKK